MEQKNNSNLLKILGLIVIILVAGVIAWQVFENTQKEKNITTQPEPTIQTGNAEGQSQNRERNRYRNGKYSAKGAYQSPAQMEEVEVTLTITDGVITSGEFISKATHPTSKKLQGMFAEGFEEAVVGKNIDEVNLTVVNGSSLTPKGFMDALSKIKTQAQS